MGSESSGFRPPWQAVLNFEFALRKAALRLVVYDGHDLAASFGKARNDTELGESKFITPLLLVHTLAPSYGPSRLAPPFPSQELRFPKGKDAKGGWKGRGKGRGKVGQGSFRIDPGLPTSPPEGKSICFAHNNTEEKCRSGKSCRWAHVCRKCFAKDHTISNCPKASQDENGVWK